MIVMIFIYLHPNHILFYTIRNRNKCN